MLCSFYTLIRSNGFLVGPFGAEEPLLLQHPRPRWGRASVSGCVAVSASWSLGCEGRPSNVQLLLPCFITEGRREDEQENRSGMQPPSRQTGGTRRNSRAALCAAILCPARFGRCSYSKTKVTPERTVESES